MLQATHQAPPSAPLPSFAEEVERDAARVAELLPRLRSRDGCLDRDVLKELQSFGAAAVPGLIAAIDLKKRYRLWICRAVLDGSMLIVILCTIPASSYIRRLQAWYLFVPALVLAYRMGVKRLLKPDDTPILRALMEREDLRALGVLIHAFAFPLESDEALAREIRRHLAKLLPRLGGGDGFLLDKGERRILRRILRRYGHKATFGLESEADSEFALAIVKALVQIGDAATLPTLRRLARRAYHEDVRRIAQLGVAELEVRVTAERAAP